MGTIIKIENLSKQYRLGTIGTGTLSHDLNRWWARIRGKEDPTLKIGSENNLNAVDSDYVWALKDINIDIEQGEVLGIIGKNGAGKSTLLKLLSRITSPTTGRIRSKGRIASLLEVGTGFHAEMTGKENIFLNGAILGMTRKEIKSKLDEIIDFAGVEKYIDTPVKRYSSGMYVRLAFAVAAHLDPEVLVVDEVLAVGDAEFQKKALGKMKDVSQGQGRTVLFVSHNMAAVKNLCRKAILLEQGKLLLEGNVFNIIDEYLKVFNLKINDKNDILKIINQLPHDPIFRLENILISQNGHEVTIVQNSLPISIEITYLIHSNIQGFRLYFDLYDTLGTLIFRSFHDEESDGIPTIAPGKYLSKTIIPKDILGPTNYEIGINAGIYNVRNCFGGSEIKIPIQVEATGKYNKAYVNDTFRGALGMHLTWETKQL